MQKIICFVSVAALVACVGAAGAQELQHRPSAPAAISQSVPLTLPAGTPLQVALDKEVRIRQAGQTIQGKIVEPAYAYDQLVVPVGTEVIGKITEIKSASATTRVRAAMDANFSPHRDVVVQFDELVLSDGRHIAMQTVVSPGAAGVLEFTTAQSKEKKKNKTKQAASDQVTAAKKEIHREWDTAKAEITQTGRVHRLERYGESQLPVHPQYLQAGTRFNAELQQPLAFGSETLPPEQLADLGNPPPEGSIVHALLLTPLNSAVSKKDDSVEAVITEPIFAADHLLVLPQGSRLLGSVLEARPARKFQHNGQLRINFRQVVLPGGTPQHVETNLEGVEAARDENLKLDTEGGAEVTSPKSRYIGTAISVALAASSFHSDIDNGVEEHAGGTFTNRTANGANGLGVVGIVLGACVHSRAMSSAFGIYGASMSVYAHFLARGRDVHYPKGTAMIISIGARSAPPPAAAPAASTSVRPQP